MAAENATSDEVVPRWVRHDPDNPKSVLELDGWKYAPSSVSPNQELVICPVDGAIVLDTPSATHRHESWHAANDLPIPADLDCGCPGAGPSVERVHTHWCPMPRKG